MKPEKTTGGGSHRHFSFVLTEYHPSWRDFERWAGTLADDECIHGRTPAERSADPRVCPCRTRPRYPRDARRGKLPG